MKIKIYIALAAFLLSILPPVQFNVDHETQGGKAVLVTLDVCSASGFAVSAHADMPFVCESACKLSVCSGNLLHENADTSFIPFLIAFQLERPPKV